MAIFTIEPFESHGRLQLDYSDQCKPHSKLEYKNSTYTLRRDEKIYFSWLTIQNILSLVSTSIGKNCIIRFIVFIYIVFKFKTSSVQMRSIAAWITALTRHRILRPCSQYPAGTVKGDKKMVITTDLLTFVIYTQNTPQNNKIKVRPVASNAHAGYIEYATFPVYVLWYICILKLFELSKSI